MYGSQEEYYVPIFYAESLSSLYSISITVNIVDGIGVKPMSDDKIGKERIFDYAWEWFKYHAEQRLTAFRFFTIFLGLLILALIECLKDGYYSFLWIIALISAFISVVFLMLDFRNQQLVELGKNALLKLEQTDKGFETLSPEFRLQESDLIKRNLIVSHQLWYIVIYLGCFGISFILACLFLNGWIPVACDV